MASSYKDSFPLKEIRGASERALGWSNCQVHMRPEFNAQRYIKKRRKKEREK